MNEAVVNQETMAWPTRQDHRAEAVAAPAAATTRSAIRSFRKSDIPRVCQMFSHTFRFGKTYRVDDLAACLEETYFGAPAYTESTGSIVHLNAAGLVDGFMGVIAITMVVDGRPLRAGILSAYMADDPDNHPAIGVSLARGVVARNFDVLFTDTANRTSLDISRAMRFSLLPMQSLEWVKILRPAGTGLYFFGKRFPRLASLLRPLSRGADALYRRRFASRDLPAGKALDGVRRQPLAAREFAEAARPFLELYDVHPAWADLDWFMAQAELQTKYGAIHICEVLDRLDRRIGLYLLYAHPNRVAYALQILASRGREELVVATLIAHAAELGAVAVRGPTSQDIAKGLMRQKGIVYHYVMGTIAWTRDKEVATAMRGGNIFLGGLVGETWARIVTEDFS